MNCRPWIHRNNYNEKSSLLPKFSQQVVNVNIFQLDKSNKKIVQSNIFSSCKCTKSFILLKQKQRWKMPFFMRPEKKTILPPTKWKGN